MEQNQEGITLETVDLETDGIVMPNVEDNVEETETEDTETQAENTTEIDEEKESLKRALNAERKARKTAEKENKNFEARLKALEEASKTPQKTTEEELIENGVDESVAKSIAAAIDKKQGNTNAKLEKELADVKFKSSLNEKSREEGFEDIIDYADEIKDFVDKGLTIEQSYYAVTYGKAKTRDTKSEIERKVEAKMQNNQARKEILGNYNSQVGTSNNNKPKIKLTAEEKAIASMSGMTPEEYAAIRDMDTVKDFEKYNSRKKK